MNMYDGAGLVNLVAEIEQRLTGSAPMPGLEAGLAALIPEAESYIVVLFDGLGAHQLAHTGAASMSDHLEAVLLSPFPSTTTVSLASVATGLPPSQHGLLGYQLWLSEADHVVNTIKWTTLWGDPVGGVDLDAFLPAGNLWERLADAGLEPITVQPAHFAASNLSRVLYRGCRFEPVFTEAELASAAIQLAAEPGRMVFVYVPHVDFAAHVTGQDSDEYSSAIETVNHVWKSVVRRLPEGAAAIGTADHGHVDIPADRQVKLARGPQKELILYGDSRVMFVRGEGAALADDLPAQWVPLAQMVDWWGPAPHHPRFEDRAPDGALVADAGHIVLHARSDERLIGHHGGLAPAELEIPLLVAGGP